MKSTFIMFFLMISFTSYCQELKDSVETKQSNQSNTLRDSIKPSTKFNHQNSIQLELLGSGGAYSLNYERILINRNRWKTVANIGIDVRGGEKWIGFLVPIGITELLSFKSHHIEMGMSVASGYTQNRDHGGWYDLYVMGRIGYRYQKPNGRFIARIGYTPFIYPETFTPWGGIAFGYAF